MGERQDPASSSGATGAPVSVITTWAAGAADEIDRWPLASNFGDIDLGIAMLDGLGRVVLLSAAFEKMTGRAGADVIGRSLADVLPDGRSVDLDEVLEQVMRMSSATVPGLDLDGRAMDLQITWLPGEPQRFAAQLFGVEEVSRLREASTSVSGFELSFDQLAVGTVITGMDGNVVRSNSALSKMLGYQLEPGTPAVSIVHPESQPAVYDAAIAALSADSDGWRAESRLVRGDGSELWVLECASLVRDDKGEPLHFLSQFIDISERKAAEAALQESQHRVSFLAGELPVAVVEVDAHGTIVNGNQALFELVDRNVVGEELRSVVHPDDYDGLIATFRERGYRDSVLEFRLNRHDFVERWVRANVRVKVDEHGNLKGSLSTWTDMTDEFQARAQSNQFGEVVETIEDMLAITDPEGGLLYLNFAGRILLDDPERPLDGLNLADIFEPQSASEIREVALSTARNFGSWKGNVAVINQSFERLDLQLSLSSHVSDTGEIYLSAMTRDITDLKRAERDLYQQATTDALTSLPNRAKFFDRLGHELARTSRNGGGLAVLFVDLDRFKAVNDTMGHEAGDELLIQVAHRLQTCVRGSDTVARIGGDEFVILAEPILRVEDAQIIGERMVRAIGEPFELSGGVANIGASIGLAMGDRSSTPRGLLKEADLAAYQAKAGGRSCLVVAGATG